MNSSVHTFRETSDWGLLQHIPQLFAENRPMCSIPLLLVLVLLSANVVDNHTKIDSIQVEVNAT